MDKNVRKELDGDVSGASGSKKFSFDKSYVSDSEYGRPTPKPESSTPPEMPVVERIVYRDVKRSTVGYWVAIVILFIVACLGLGWGYSESEESDYFYYLYELATDAYADLESESKVFDDKYPVAITDIEIANVEQDMSIITDYGHRLYRSEAKFLAPRVTLTSKKAQEVVVYLKWYNPDNDLITGSSSPDGFSQKLTMDVYEGSQTVDLDGWGYTEAYSWHYGTNRLEIWCDDVCLGSKKFKIY